MLSTDGWTPAASQQVNTEIVLRDRLPRSFAVRCCSIGWVRPRDRWPALFCEGGLEKLLLFHLMTFVRAGGRAG